jgi:hypothetical protein
LESDDASPLRGAVGEVQRGDHRFGADRRAPDGDERADAEAEAQSGARLRHQVVHAVSDQLEGQLRKPLLQGVQLRLDVPGVECQAVDRDRDGDRREQREGGVEGAAGGGQGDAVRQAGGQRVAQHLGPPVCDVVGVW